jgi:gamma-glutamylcyclotransferase (GGCT)/AIG2-like uncharacterized protein YtfP
MTEPTLVFVYGTLVNMHKRLGTKLLGIGYTVDPFVLYDGGYPSVVKEEGVNEEYKGQVIGQLHEVDDNQLSYLDGYEGHPHHYERKQINIFRHEGSSVYESVVWMYHGPDDSYVHRTPVKPNAEGRVWWPVMAQHLGV